DHPHAVRVLARAWVYVIWRCWQDGVAYDPARRGGAQRYGSASSPTDACPTQVRLALLGAAPRRRIPGWDASRRAQLSLGALRRLRVVVPEDLERKGCGRRGGPPRVRVGTDYQREPTVEQVQQRAPGSPGRHPGVRRPPAGQHAVRMRLGWRDHVRGVPPVQV